MSVLYAPKKFKSLRIHKNPKYGTITQKKINKAFNCVIARGFGHTNWRNIEAGRRTLTKQLKRRAKVSVKIRLTQPVTNKPKQSRMGKGKGKFKGWVGFVRPGTQMYTMGYTTKGAIELCPDIETVDTKKLPFSKIRQKFNFPIQILEKSINYPMENNKNNPNRSFFKKHENKINVFTTFYEVNPNKNKRKKFWWRRFKKHRRSKKILKNDDKKVFFFTNKKFKI